MGDQPTFWKQLWKYGKKYSVQKGFDNWIVDAAAYDHWMLMKRDFLPFT